MSDALASRPNVVGGAAQRGVRTGSVLQHAEAEQAVRNIAGKRHPEEIGLDEDQIVVTAIGGIVGLDGPAVIDGEDGCAGGQCVLGEPPRGAAGLDQHVSVEPPRTSGLVEEASLPQAYATRAVVLSAGMDVPLEAEALRVSLVDDEPRQVPGDRV